MAETEKWARKKVVVEVFEEPFCTSPLTVACRQLNEEDEIKPIHQFTVRERSSEIARDQQMRAGSVARRLYGNI